MNVLELSSNISFVYTFAGLIVLVLVIGAVGWRFWRKMPSPAKAMVNSETVARVGDAESIAPLGDAETVAVAPPPASGIETNKKSLGEALRATRLGFGERLRALMGRPGALSTEQREELEEILFSSDLGPQTVQKLLQALAVNSDSVSSEALRESLKSEMLSILTAVAQPACKLPLPSAEAPTHRPQVWLIVGVNGAGKTTTIGKLSARLAGQGHKVLVAAGDTFRAAAGEQLRVWTELAQVEIFAAPAAGAQATKDPSAIAFDACQKAVREKFDCVLIDTAGRLHTATGLMEELKKMKRVIAKLIDGAPQEVLIVLDANSGQNALHQARQFHQALGATGVILTKLDGSAKGGVALGVAGDLRLPVRLIGVGEGLEDLRDFSAREFVDSIF